MPGTATFDPDHGLIRVAYAGVVTAKELQLALRDVVRLCQETGRLKVLADCTQMTGGHDLFDLMELIAKFEARCVPHTFNEALLMHGQLNRREIEFYETAALNRGFNVRIFEDEAAALAWLGA